MKPRSTKIWKEIATDLEGKLSTASLHLAVYHNQHNWQTKLKNLLGLNIETNVLNDKEESKESSLSSSSSSSSLKSSERKLFKFSVPYVKFRLKSFQI